jgi:hypothetical protein
VTVLTPDDIASYLSWYGAAQGIDAMRPRFPRWIRHMRELGVADVPLTLGSASARHIDRMALQVSTNPEAKLRAHDARDTQPEIRPYKGRTV